MATNDVTQRAGLAAKRAVLRALRSRGYELHRVGAAPRALRRGDRLVAKPAFILSTVRSGSTLLRVLLDSHSQIHSPPELHLRDLDVQSKSQYSERALKAIRLDTKGLQYLLWDRVLHRELAASGKRLLVNKTPSDVFIADRLLECWPDARFIFLLRHPAAIAASRQAVRPLDTAERNAETVPRYGDALEPARATCPALPLPYEDLAGGPQAVTKHLDAFVGAPSEASMLEYGRFDRGD